MFEFCFTASIIFLYKHYVVLLTSISTNFIKSYFIYLRLYSNIEKRVMSIYNNNPFFKHIVDIAIYTKNFTYYSLLNKKIEPYNNNWVSISLLTNNTYEFNESYDFVFNLINNISTNESSYIEWLKYDLLEKRFYSFCEYSKSIFDYSNNVKEIMITMKYNNKYIHYNFYKGKYNFITLKYPSMRANSKFITVKYLHPMMSYPIYLELNNIYIVNNRILSACFVKRLLEYQPKYYIFDNKYSLEIIDNNINTINLKSNQYIELDETRYKIVNVE